MGVVLKLAFVAVTAGVVSGCLAAMLVGALGWPFSVVWLLAGAGAGAAAVRAARRIAPRAPAPPADSPAEE